MTVDEALATADEWGKRSGGVSGAAAVVLAAEVRRLRRDLEVFRDAGHAAELRIVELRAQLETVTRQYHASGREDD